MAKVGLNRIPTIGTWKTKNNNTKYARQKNANEIIIVTHETINIKGNKQDYGARLYLKLRLNKFKIMGFYLYLYLLET
jgi:hypothetical protein